MGNITQIINVWNYRGDVNGVSGGDAAGLVNAMGLNPTAGVFPADTIGDALQALLSNTVQWNSVLCRNVYDPLDYIDLPFVPVATGDGTGEVLSPINAFGLKSNRVRLDIGRGYKRFPGVLETQVATLGDLTSGAVTALALVASKMGEIITFTDGTLTDTFTPCIVGKKSYTTPRGKKAYKYWPTLTEQLTHLAVGVTWQGYSQVRSQVSRQVGKGS
jgi:hypothetical protein